MLEPRGLRFAVPDSVGKKKEVLWIIVPLALGISKASKENWFVAFLGVAFLAWALKFAENIPFPSDLLVYAVAFGVMATIGPLWEHMKKYTAERMKKYAAEIEAKENS